jgi:hypothetical protein
VVITLQKKVPGPPSTLHEHFQKLIGNPGSKKVKPIERLHKTRVFVAARSEGATIPEAREIARLPAKLSANQILNSPAGQIAIAQILDKEEEFKDPGIVKRLKEMWLHKKTRLQKVGDEVVHIEEDDTDMWKFSMDKVLTLKGHQKSGGDAVTNVLEATGGVTFNVLAIKDDK